MKLYLRVTFLSRDSTSCVYGDYSPAHVVLSGDKVTKRGAFLLWVTRRIPPKQLLPPSCQDQVTKREGHFSFPSLHPFLEPEHTVEVFVIFFFLPMLWNVWVVRIMRIWMKRAEEFHCVETALIDVEVDIPRLEVRRTGLPDDCVRV